MKESETPANKKFGTLGPRGRLRRYGGKNIYGDTPENKYSGRSLGGGLEGKVGGLAAFFREEEKMKQEGYGLFPASFDPPSFHSKKTFYYVDHGSVVTCNYLKLAKYNYSSPFTLSSGDSQPLTRYNRVRSNISLYLFSCLEQQ